MAALGIHSLWAAPCPSLTWHSIDSIGHRGVSDLTDPDGLECLPVVAECQEEVVLAVGGLGAGGVVELLVPPARAVAPLQGGAGVLESLQPCTRVLQLLQASLQPYGGVLQGGGRVLQAALQPGPVLQGVV